MSYEKSTTSDLKSELTIPYGMAKKILLFLNQRSSNHLKNLFQIEMAKWTVTEVQDFIRKSVTVQSNDINEICRVIADEQIDGLVFLSYKDAKELQLEVPGSKELGVIYRRILLKRDEILDNNRLLQSKPIQKEQVLQVTAKDKNPLAFQTPIKNPAYLLPKEWDSYIRNVLQLDICETKSKNKTCLLTIIHSDWKDRNVFEKKMLFFILTDCPDGQENCLDKKHGSFLWNKIRKHTHTWLDHFTEEDKTMFKISRQREDSVFLNNKAITLSKGHVKMRYILESNVEALGQSDYVFLLINKNILLKDTDCYCTYLENPGKKKAIELFFTLKPSFKYWTYVPDDSSFDFVLECIPSELCGQRPVDDKIPEALQSSGHSLAENSLFGSAVINRESSIEMTGDEIIPEQTNIDQQNAEQISVTKANQEDEKVQGTKSSSHNIQIPRRFKDESSEIQYTEGKRVSTAEHNGSVSYRCYEYKFVPENLISKGSDAVCLFINKETIKFACGCMNSRKNGTIMFGIGDSTPDGKSKYKHGEIVGVPLNSVQGDIRRILTESLRTAILRCFESFVSQTADKCISNPVFVPVISRLPCSQAYVIEIDIEPSSVFCKEIYFKINRNNITNSSNIEKENTLYVREGVGTCSKTKQQEKLFLQTELKDIIRKREEDEKQMARQEMYESPETPMDKLRRIISRGSNMLDNSVWPILCFNKPTGEQKRSEHWIQCLKFIKVINFHAVFDFDDESNNDGLCAAHRNEERSILQDEEIFFDLAGSKLDLASKLGIPDENKTVWIFCNGRKDIKPCKPCKNPENWTIDYSAGIRDAVIFFSQKEIIPKGRALVIVLLFSNNFDGIIETIREMTIRFGWEQMVIIATENVLKRFKVEYRDMTAQIDEYSISGKGMTWEHVNATFLELTGCKDQENVILPTSSGAFVPADAKFVETLAEFNILSAKQCENKEFQTENEREEFSSKTELSFYRGEKVEWFNFYFRTHVLKRQIFDRVESTISKILGGDQKILSTVIISHEPGAGGTTLARNLLWTFRKKCRCAIITKITERTAKNVMSLWRHKEESENNAKPLLLLVDDLEQSDLTFEDLRRQIYIEYRSNPKVNNLVCCCILCQRETEIHYIPSLQHDYSVNTSSAIFYYLKQKLDKPEKQWMDRKYKELEEKGADCQPDYLLSFMILRKGFSPSYIRNTISKFLLYIDVSSNEFELLAYTALLSTYTPKTKRGPSAFIPVECCDNLMGYSLTKTVLWEKNMSNALKIFLVIEQKETASGKQVKMSHPALAEPVLLQILTKRNETLSSLTQRFLDCTILQSSSYGRQILINFTKEMLVRRLKEEYNDDRTTSFSPLVEEICMSETSWINARTILETVFTKILVNDHYIPQTLARLCSKHEDFEKGIEYGKLSVEMSMGNKVANGFCHQSLAICLADQFKHEKAKIKAMICPKDAVKYLKIILEAYSNFLDASRLRKGNADHILYPIQGVLNTIINCLKFIKKKVRCKFAQHVMMFVSDDTFSPPELKDWMIFKPILNTFLDEGEKALAIIEQCLCFHTTFYAHDDTSHDRVHRLYRGLQYRYPFIYNDYSEFFGANGDELPPHSDIPEVTNDWHRRRLIKLGGNSYMNIFYILRNIKDRSMSFNREDGIKKSIEIKKHLMYITDKIPKDIINLVSVNVVLGLLGGEKRDSTKTIMEHCKQVIKMRRDYEDVAYFFICLLMWPSCQKDIEYDDQLFYESLKFLHRKKETIEERPRDFRYVFFKEEKNITQPTTHFFLTNGLGFKSLCHSSEWRGTILFNSAAWERFVSTHNLKRLRGDLRFHNGKTCIFVANEKSPSSDLIEIRRIRSGKKEFNSQEEVYFYLGFSISGPIAYHVKPTRYEDTAIEQSFWQDDERVDKFLEEDEEHLQKKLDTIKDLKSKLRNGRHLKERDVSICIFNCN